MKILIAEDDFVCRRLMQEQLREYGDAHVAVNGNEVVAAVKQALEKGEPYDLICLDILMPEMNGHEALTEVRRLEKEAGFHLGKATKIIMTTALNDKKNVMDAFRSLADGYLLKPIEPEKLRTLFEKLHMLPE